ncbi:flagellar basal body L-ring protein FlgH [Sphingosinicella sp. LHD-64]|uniref:flagellar basal body L-ring protein FlgH n=1 Tax=Sphingosinicella sp. LHD-64 TaxID=3072139 RepID=UPI00280EA06C|nr:flagellar basal body L-ring protein FlgH [Sphingosinicella sp. LHD-64]MDQ8757189.1 flagellar basal body L-ring protein FlgH [Sphingosinicella sp. LHD-64]
MAHALLIAACLFCASRAQPQEEFRPAPPPAPPPAAANGAIFQASNGFSPLTSGQRAGAVGDVLTIVLVERTQGSSSSSSGTNREGNIGLTPPSTGPLSFFQPSDVAAGGQSEFDGRGQTGQSNSLVGEITVTVHEVFPNGVMRVRGEKQLRINRGHEFIRLSGLIRFADVGPDNRVPSTRVADAQIEYLGRGEIARASRQGWLQRFFSMLSPF